MANPSTPFGFQYVGLIDGSSPNFGIKTVRIDPTNAKSIYGGDIAKPISGGYFDVATEIGGGEMIGGVFLPDFIWQSKGMQQTARQRAWLGQTGDIIASGTLTAKIVVNPQALFRVRSLGAGLAPIAQASVGLNANFNVGAGPGNNLISTFSLDDATIGVGAALPFTIYDIDQLPESDPTSNFNTVLVRFNNQVVL